MQMLYNSKEIKPGEAVIEILSAIDKTSELLASTISGFTQFQFNQVPFEGSWTAAQVVAHLVKSESGLPALLRGASRPANNLGREKIKLIKAMFLDFEIRMKSPDQILLNEGPKDKIMLLASLLKNRYEILHLVKNVDLSQIFTEFPFPELGELTGWEWLCFMDCHAMRHLRQLRNIHASLLNNIAGPVSNRKSA